MPNVAMEVAGPRRPIPGTIGLLFGGLWGVLAGLAAPASWRGPGVLLAVLVSMILIYRLWRRGGAVGMGSGLFRRGPYLVAVALEFVAISAAANLLPRFGLGAYFIESLGLIVGLHFVGLWKATGQAAFLWIAAGMCSVSIAAMGLPQAWNGIEIRQAVTGFGNALVLWIGAGRSTAQARPV